MPWLELRVTTSRAYAERVETSLTALGALAVTLQDAADQPLLEPKPGETPLWDHAIVTGLFDHAVSDPQTLTQQLNEHLGASIAASYTFKLVADQDWERAWMDNFHPLQCGSRLWICPTGYPPPDPQAVNILLDPGLAFGTGSHPTTALCLEWLDQTDLAGRVVIDYGCGSGILAIAAARLGAREVWAVDYDPQALLASGENAARNQVSACVHPLAPENLPTSLVADVIVANILARPLIELAAELTGHLRPEGLLVLSGLLTDQAADVAAAYPQIHWQTQTVREDWVRLQGLKEEGRAG